MNTISTLQSRLAFQASILTGLFAQALSERDRARGNVAAKEAARADTEQVASDDVLEAYHQAALYHFKERRRILNYANHLSHDQKDGKQLLKFLCQRSVDLVEEAAEIREVMGDAPAPYAFG